SMKANTAICFLLAGASLWLLRSELLPPPRRRLGQGCAGVVALVGLLTLSQYFFGWDLGIDQLLFREAPGTFGTSSPGRMAPNTALSFLLVGLALLFLTTETHRGHCLSHFLTIAIGFTGLLAVTGYAYNVNYLYGIASYTRMALHTAV